MTVAADVAAAPPADRPEGIPRSAQAFPAWISRSESCPVPNDGELAQGWIDHRRLSPRVSEQRPVTAAATRTLALSANRLAEDRCP